MNFVVSFSTNFPILSSGKISNQFFDRNFKHFPTSQCQHHMSSIRILFEQIEPSAPPILSDCSLNSLTIRPEILSEQKSKIEYRDCEAGTDVEKIDKCCGPSTLKVNAATKYEFQKLNATQIHRAINDPKLSEFLLRVYPLLREELDDSNLFNKLK